MKHIEKKQEPPLVKRYKKEFTEENRKYSDFGSYPPDETEKADDQIRASLAEEQGYLCAYCMKELKDVTSIRIEHWTPQNYAENPNLGKKLATEYKNLLGVCTGYIHFDSEKSEAHCEKKRGNTPLFINPQDKNHIAQIKYDTNGRIFSENENFENDLHQTLNLNIDILKKNRIAKWEGVKIGIEKLSQKQGKIGILEKELKKWKNKSSKNGQEQFREYCQIVIYFLEKELKKAQKNSNKFHK